MPDTSLRNSVLTGTTDLPSRCVIILSCKYFAVGPWTIFSSISRILFCFETILRLKSYKSEEALSLRSSSDLIAKLIFSSRYLFGTRESNNASSDVPFKPSQLLRHCFTLRIMRSVSATFNNSRIDSTPPTDACFMQYETFSAAPNDGAAYLAINKYASSVFLSFSRTLSQLLSGCKFIAICAESAIEVSLARRSNILSSSSVFAHFVKSYFIGKYVSPIR